MTTFIVNGEEKEVEYLTNGIDISQDFIGNTSHGMDSDDEGRYIASQDDYNWWVEVIAKHQELDVLVAQCREIDDDLVEQVLADNGDYDIEDIPARTIEALKEAFDAE